MLSKATVNERSCTSMPEMSVFASSFRRHARVPRAANSTRPGRRRQSRAPPVRTRSLRAGGHHHRSQAFKCAEARPYNIVDRGQSARRHCAERPNKLGDGRIPKEALTRCVPVA